MMIEKPQWIMSLEKPYLGKVYEFVFNPTKLSVQKNFIEIARTLPKEILIGVDEIEILRTIADHVDKIVEMVALSIHNDPSSPVPPTLKEYLGELDQLDILQALNYSMAAQCLEYFAQSVMLISGTANILIAKDSSTDD